MRLKNAALAVMLTLFVASSAAAALSPQYEAWRNGPVQWIMTGAEKGAWKKVKTDEEAGAFIDLFWARRDPTPNTAMNEARDEHDAREKQADERFSERGKRGSLTDRGRAWYVLGPPPGYTANMARAGVGGPIATGSPQSQTKSGATSGGSTGGDGSEDLSGGRQLGARDIWIWEHDEASAKFNLPRVEIIFITDPVTRRTIRDLARRDFGAAESAVLKKQIVTADMTELPAWAAFGGLTPMTREVRFVDPPAKVVVPKPVQSEVTTPALPPAGPVSTTARGASRFTLVHDAYTIDAQTSADPFNALKAVSTFKKTEELGWVAQFCTGSEQEVSVPFILHITGTAAGKKIDRATAPDELVPDRLKARPGCSMIRGALPLDDFAPGTYRLELMIDDPINKSESYTLGQDFTVE